MSFSHRKSITAVAVGASWALSAGLAFGQNSLPMKYFPDASVTPPPGDASRIYVGAGVTQSGNDIVVQPTGILYVAPNTAHVQATAFQQYATANCSVVTNERVNEATASDLMRFQLDQIKNFKEDIAYYNNESRSSRRSCLDARKTHATDATEKCDYAKEVSAAVKDLGDQLAPWSKQIAELSDASVKRLDLLGRQPGGFAVATLSLYNPDVLAAVKQANPSHQANWVDVKDVTFSFTTAEEGIADTPDNVLTMRTTLGFSLAGQPLPPGQVEGTTAAKSAIASGGTVALGVTLSRLGACDTKLRRGADFFYKFDSYSYVKGTALINRWAAFEKLETNSSHGGLFTTSSVHELHEDLKGGQTQTVIVDGVPEGSELELERSKLEAEVLSDLVSEMGTAQNVKANAAAVMGLPTPGQDGAAVLSDGLAKCPHVYCQVGSWAFKGLNAVFGSTRSREEIHQQEDHKVERRYSYAKRHDEHGAAAAIVEWNN